MQIETVCILGSDGFVGSALRHHLRFRGYRLVLVGRRESPTDLAEGETYINPLTAGSNQLSAVLRGSGPTVMIDCVYAVVPNTKLLNPVDELAINARNILGFIEQAREGEVLKYIYLSSGGTVYGDAGPIAIDEDIPLRPVGTYGLTKLVCERFVELQAPPGLQMQIVRPANVYGPGQLPFRGQGIVATAIGSAIVGRPFRLFGDGDQIRDFLYVEDFCAAIERLIVHPETGGIVNLGSGEGFSANQILGFVEAEATSRGLDFKVEQIASRSPDISHNILSIRRMTELTGWVPTTSLTTGIAKTWNWIECLPSNP